MRLILNTLKRVKYYLPEFLKAATRVPFRLIFLQTLHPKIRYAEFSLRASGSQRSRCGGTAPPRYIRDTTIPRPGKRSVAEDFKLGSCWNSFLVDIVKCPASWVHEEKNNYVTFTPGKLSRTHEPQTVYCEL